VRISRLTIKNFRSISELDLELSQCCVLVGANNAGKSNILLALHRVLGYDWASVTRFQPDEDRFMHDPANDVEIVAFLDPPYQYQKTKAENKTAIHAVRFSLTRYKEKARAGEPRLEQACLDKNETVASIHVGQKDGGGRKYEPLHSIPREIQEALPLLYIRADRQLRDQLPAARYSVLRTLLDDINRDFNDPNSTVEVTYEGKSTIMPRAKRWGQLMNAAMALLRTQEFQDLEDDINRNALRQLGFTPGTDDLAFSFGPLPTIDFYRALELQLTEAGLTVDATSLGQGFQNAVFMAILEAYEKRKKQGAVFLIEEPEISLHPQSQRALASTLTAITATNQVIYTTHSPYFVGIPEFKNVRLIRRRDGKTTRAASDLEPTPELTEKLRKEVDPERSELFFARRLLIVEGDTEKLALPEYSARLKIDLDRAGASIIESGGKTNLLPLAEIAASFGIPTAIVYDRDSGSFKDRRDEEQELNKSLAAFDDPSKNTKAWCLEPDYEGVLRGVLGEEAYQAQCQKYPGVSKAVRAHLIAADADTPILPAAETALNWLKD
jgi:putative ATP-dependent endonuclease of the OLD family